jgi:hypothetical protein
MSPAQGDTVNTLDTILGNAPLVGTYWKQIELWYGLAGQLVGGSQSGGQLDQIKALIQASQTQIVGQVDALATANVTSELDLSIEQLENIDAMTPDQLAAYVTQTVRTVTDAKADIAAETDKARLVRKFNNRQQGTGRSAPCRSTPSRIVAQARAQVTVTSNARPTSNWKKNCAGTHPMRSDQSSGATARPSSTTATPSLHGVPLRA